jgi:protein-L-isoaspartate(D-aspartate) O-methyltransferase
VAKLLGATSAVTARRFPIRLDRIVHGHTSAGSEVVRVAAQELLPESSKAPQSERSRMVLRLAQTGMMDARVLQVIGDVPREVFVDSGLVAQAHEDTALPIGHGQTISKPSMVARMLSLAMEGHHARRRSHLGRTLEIGTGCGYQAALLSRLALSVISVERLRGLHDSAREALAKSSGVRRQSIRLVLGDGRLGHPPNAPYDTIISAAVGLEVPKAWLEQLAVGGRLIAPLGEGDTQSLVVVDRGASGLVRRIYESVRFVPLESGVVR